MKPFLAILGVFAIGLLAYSTLQRYKNFGSIVGYVVLEETEGRGRPVPDLRIFLIRNAIVPSLDSLIQWYATDGLPLETTIDAARKHMVSQRAALEAEAVLLGDDRLTDPDFQHNEDAFNQVYREFLQAKQPLDSLQYRYNQRIRQLIEDYNVRQVVTDTHGRFEISRLQAGYWYLYAFYGNLLGNISWFERLFVRGETRVVFSRENATTLLK